ncbi:MAG: STAS domain-containing protein [Ktedonobacteraceae bacterium]|nr:STAS domain-containing protein [Ktedonobacteraceae bacterium]
MSAKTLEATVRHQPSVSVVDLHGEINIFAESVLNNAYAEAEARGLDVILLNFSDVSYINSTGIALIVSLIARARKQHRRLLACGLSSHYVEIFQVTRLIDFLNIFPDETSALVQEFGRPHSKPVQPENAMNESISA